MVEYVYDCSFVMHAANNKASEIIEEQHCGEFDAMLDLTHDFKEPHALYGRLTWNEIGGYMAACMGALPSELS